MTDLLARNIPVPTDPTLAMVFIEDADVLIQRLVKLDDGHPAVDADEVWRRVGTVGQTQVVRDGISVRTWRAVPDNDEFAVTGPTKRAAVRGMLAVMGIVEAKSTVTSDPLF